MRNDFPASICSNGQWYQATRHKQDSQVEIGSDFELEGRPTERRHLSDEFDDVRWMKPGLEGRRQVLNRSVLTGNDGLNGKPQMSIL